MKPLNAHSELLAYIDELNLNGTRKSLLLHCCCAPCSTACLEILVKAFDVTCFFYNPNMSDEREYDYRLGELKRFLKVAYSDAIHVIDGGYDHGEFLAAVKGRESLPEGGERCRICLAMRLNKTAKRAKNGGFDHYATTLTVSPHKDAAYINSVGRALGGGYIPTDFKKQGGFLRSTKLSGEYGLYRQDYCGCEFSKKERQARNDNDKD